MPLYHIRNVPVEFPYPAYDLQIAYMEHVIQSLQEKKHALLESPTGTGKTLCLLCATLAWRQTQEQEQKRLAGDQNQEEAKLPPIIYSSRTHSQLSQAMKEIKKTKYKMRATILGSRQQQCCNPKLNQQQGTAKNHACVQLVRSKRCEWHSIVETEPHDRIHAHALNVMDIEDLNKLTKGSQGPCPYYLTRKMAEIADIVFVPYNYLVDMRARQSIVSLFSWTGSVVIFDEAHNIEQSCSEASSFDLPVSILTNTVLELERAIRMSSKRLQIQAKSNKGKKSQQGDQKRPTLTKSYATLIERAHTLNNMIKTLEQNLSKMKLTKEGKSFPGEHIFKIFSEACVTDQNWKILTDALNDAAELLVDDSQTGQDSNLVVSRLNGSACAFLADALEKAFDTQESPAPNAAPYHKLYRVHIHDDKTASGMSRIVLSYWCFSPGIAMKKFVTEFKVNNIILTSGTLSPMDSFAAELHLAFPIRLENSHVIDDNQALVQWVPVGPTGAALDSSYKFRDDPRYKTDLGNAVIQFVKIIPGGILMFFPSYIVLQSCLDFWKSKKQGTSSIWNRILQAKPVIVEPQDPTLFPSKIREYQKYIAGNESKGCILFAVCRGKVSEGIDFSDGAGRAVILAGIPYAQLTDPKVKLKREFLNCQRGSALTGSQWYCQMAIRAVNQAMGRVIRHKDDYGAILLCDRRFGDKNTQVQLSKWLRGMITRHNSFGAHLASIHTFFKQNQQATAQVLESGSDCDKAVSMAGAWKRESLLEEMSTIAVSPKRRKTNASVGEDEISSQTTRQINKADINQKHDADAKQEQRH